MTAPLTPESEALLEWCKVWMPGQNFDGIRDRLAAIEATAAVRAECEAEVLDVRAALSLYAAASEAKIAEREAEVQRLREALPKDPWRRYAGEAFSYCYACKERQPNHAQTCAWVAALAPQGEP